MHFTIYLITFIHNIKYGLRHIDSEDVLASVFICQTEAGNALMPAYICANDKLRSKVSRT